MTNWNNQYAAALRNFLSGEAGRLLLQKLDEYRPPIKSDSIETAALSAHQVMGYDMAAQVIEELANFSEEPDNQAPKFISQ